MTSNVTPSNTRPTTPFADSTNIAPSCNVEDSMFQYDLETTPRTPLGCRIPLIFQDAPPAPRPRKRLFTSSEANMDDFADIMLPTEDELMESSIPELAEDDVDSSIGARTSALMASITARPAPARLMRRSLRNVRRRQSIVSPLDQQDVVQLTYRQSPDENDDDHIFKPSENDLRKSWGPTPVAKITLKRRNSYNALCA